MTELIAPQIPETSHKLMATVIARDWEGFQKSLAPQAQAHLLLPRGPEVQLGPEAITQRVRGWFGAATDFEVLDSGSDTVGSRQRLNWRFRLSRDGSSHEVIEQVAFVDTGPEGVTRIDLVCSGFMPAPTA